MPRSAALIDGELAIAATRAPGRAGLIATAAWDEDAVTLGARAGLAVLERNPDAAPQALVVATVSPPLPEPGVAPYLAEVLDLQTTEDRHVRATEHSGSVTAGIAAVSEAVSLVADGTDSVLVVAADTRRDSKGRALGDGAVALLVGSSGNAGTMLPAGAAVELFVDRWRSRSGGVEAGDRSLDKFGPGLAFTDSLNVGDYDHVVVTGADGPALSRTGFLGCPAPLAGLLTGEPGPGDRVLVAATAGGISHAVAFTAGPGMAAITERARAQLDAGTEGPQPRAPDESTFDPFVSQSSARRERAATYRLEARRNPETGEVIYPPPPKVAAHGMESVRLRRSGTVHTFARDHVFPIGGPLTMAVATLDGGGRFYGQVAGGQTVAIGDRVNLELRRVHSGGGLPHYFWKLVPDPEET